MNARQGAFVLAVTALLLLVVAADALLQPDLQQRNYEIFTEMVYSEASQSFESSEFFANGRTQQQLVAGVVPVGRLPFFYGDGAEEALRAGRELSSPFTDSDIEAQVVGAEMYRVFCVACHDARGTGKGAVVLRGMLPPPSLHAGRATDMADGEMFHILAKGQGNMASYAAQLSAAERWAVIAHVRHLQQEGP